MRSARALDPPSASATTHLFRNRSGWYRAPMPPRSAIAEHRSRRRNSANRRCITGVARRSELLRGACGLAQARASRPAEISVGRAAGELSSPLGRRRPTMRSAFYDPSMSAARADALFASTLQRSDEPSAMQVKQAIAAATRAFGDLGCAARVAHEYGEHPETAARRMRWARTAVAGAFGSPSAPGYASRDVRPAGVCAAPRAA